MKVLKVLFVLFCLLAYAWTFSRPVKALVERNSPLFANRQMTLKIADVPAGQQVTVLEKYTTNRSDRLLVLLVEYTDKSGKELTGWFYGTLHVSYPH
jgi:hypothetical protein